MTTRDQITVPQWSKMMKAKFRCGCVVSRREILGAVNARRKALGKVTITYTTLHHIIHDAIQAFVDSCVDPDCYNSEPNPFVPNRRLGSNHIYTGTQAQRLFRLGVIYVYSRRSKRMTPNRKVSISAL